MSSSFEKSMLSHAVKCKTKTFFSLLLLVVVSCKNSNDSALLDRFAAGSLYPSVGLIMKNGTQSCSGLILKHGVFVTARHCFDFPVNAATIELHFAASDQIVLGQPGVVTVASSQIKEVKADEGSNDIAYIFYDSSATSSHSFLVETTYNKEIPEKDTPIRVVGFPDARVLGTPGQYKRI
jgi:hypothetical protein